MSLHDTLIYGLKTLWVNAVEQYDKSAIEFAGPGVSVAVANNRNVVRVDSTILYSVGAAGMAIVAGNSVCKGPVASGVQVLDFGGDPWNKIFRGVAVNAGGIGDPISVQSYGETAGINHTLWAYKPTDEDTHYQQHAVGFCRGSNTFDTRKADRPTGLLTLLLNKSHHEKEGAK